MRGPPPKKAATTDLTDSLLILLLHELLLGSELEQSLLPRLLSFGELGSNLLLSLSFDLDSVRFALLQFESTLRFSEFSLLLR